ncbi:MAG: ATP-binding cassette domain-containing protein [Planctomycetes bacterium]|nr:ATP-binding cassette domain-containing protein [Planctomycetota bacterium]
MNEETVIEARSLVRRYDKLVAVDNVSFEVYRGEIFGFLGPNGAGKTTTVRMLTGVIAPTGGTALVDGHDVVKEAIASRERLGIVPEEGNVYVDMSIWQNIMLMAELHGIARRRRRRRAEELLELFGLADRRRHKGRMLSKGLRQRLMLSMAMVSDPEILFLDEPTSGLDVASARLIREVIIHDSRERGATVFLTTHNIAEADEISSRVAIIDKGHLAAVDTPEVLRASVEASRSVEVTFASGGLDPEAIAGIVGVEKVKPLTRGLRIYTRKPGRVAQEVACLARETGAGIVTLATCEPSLEDVFLHLTGGAARDGGKPDG